MIDDHLEADIMGASQVGRRGILLGLVLANIIMSVPRGR